MYCLFPGLQASAWTSSSFFFEAFKLSFCLALTVPRNQEETLLGNSGEDFTDFR